MATGTALYYPTEYNGTITLKYGVPYQNSYGKNVVTTSDKRNWSYELLRPCIQCIKDIANSPVTSWDNIHTKSNFIKINNACNVSLFLHPGVDYRARTEGSRTPSVYSVAWGTIVGVKYLESSTWKGLIKIQHEVPCKNSQDTKKQKFWATYAHLNSTVSKWTVGKTVDAGTKLAEAHPHPGEGTKYTSMAQHLHFEIHSVGTIEFANWPNTKDDTHVNLFYYLTQNKSISDDIKDMIKNKNGSKFNNSNLWSTSAIVQDVDQASLEQSYCENINPNSIVENNKSYLSTAFHNRTYFTLLNLYAEAALNNNFANTYKINGPFYPTNSLGSFQPIRPNLPNGYEDPEAWLSAVSAAIKQSIKNPPRS